MDDIVDRIRQDIFNAQENGYDHRSLPLHQIAEQLHDQSSTCTNLSLAEVQEAVDLWHVTMYQEEHFKFSCWHAVQFGDTELGGYSQIWTNSYDDRLELVVTKLNRHSPEVREFRFTRTGLLHLKFQLALDELNAADGRVK